MHEELEELIKRLRNCVSDTVEDCAGCPYQGGYKGTYCMNGLISEAADAIEELTDNNVGKWISVTERLPYGRDSVLALTGDCEIYVCDYIPSVKQFWAIPGDELHIDDITHWMPLPEPPKEET